jgi:hypothetical protein
MRKLMFGGVAVAVLMVVVGLGAGVVAWAQTRVPAPPAPPAAPMRVLEDRAGERRSAGDGDA